MSTRTLGGVLLTVVVLAGCGSGGGAPPVTTPAAPVPTPKSSLAAKTFAADCSDFLSYAAESLTNQYLNVFQCYADAPCPVGIASASPPVAGAPATGPGAPADGSAIPGRVSGTNTQERGVDEADIVKADARGYLYILSGQTLSVLDAFPAADIDAAPLVTVNLAPPGQVFYARDLFLDQSAQRLVILGETYDAQYRARAVSVLVSVSNPLAPVEQQRLTLDGYGIDARRIDARVHRVVGFQPPLPAWFFDGSDSLARQREQYQSARNAGRDDEASRIKTEIGNDIAGRVRSAGANALLPRLGQQTPDGGSSESVLRCGSLAHPGVNTGLGLVLVDSFNSDGSLRAATGLVNNAYIAYASPANLYLAQSSAGWFFAPTQLEETAIYRLALSTTGAASFQGVGKVDGTLSGPYALSEHAGFLRVASTQSRFGPERTTTGNHLTVLNATTTGDLPQVGALRELAPGERIQGVRMIGARGYLVTFRQVDPLFGLDLSDATRPRVASELKLPGFSSYLAPVGDDYLLTVGRAGSDDGLNGQLGIQLFDVRNLAAIRQVAGISPPAGDNSYSYSTAEYDPHAFTYFPDSETADAPGTLTVPLQTYGEQESDRFTGFVVVRVEPASSTPLREIGRISHADFPDREGSCGGASSSGDAPCRDYYQLVEPRRAVFIEDAGATALLTISAVGVIASNAANPAQELARRELSYDPPCCIYYPTTTGP